MSLYEYYIIFPDGEKREVSNPLNIGMLIDVNGNILPEKLQTNKILAYQIISKRTFEQRGIIQITYILEQLSADELLDYVY